MLASNGISPSELDINPPLNSSGSHTHVISNDTPSNLQAFVEEIWLRDRAECTILNQVTTSFRPDSKGVSINYVSEDQVELTDVYGVVRSYTLVDIAGRKRVSLISGAGGLPYSDTNVLRWAYDNKMSLTDVEYAGGRVDQYNNYDDRGNPGTAVLAAGTPEQRVIQYTYHPYMNVPLSRTEVRVEENGSTLEQYTYNGLGQRVMKEDEGGRSIFYYDVSGRLLGVYNLNTGQETDYIYLGNNVVASVILGSGDYCEGASDNDGDVDDLDISAFSDDYGRIGCEQGQACQGDYDGDGDVDGADLAAYAPDQGRADCPVETVYYHCNDHLGTASKVTDACGAAAITVTDSQGHSVTGHVRGPGHWVEVEDWNTKWDSGGKLWGQLIYQAQDRWATGREIAYIQHHPFPRKAGPMTMAAILIMDHVNPSDATVSME